jgi:hypothetical protein
LKTVLPIGESNGSARRVSRDVEDQITIAGFALDRSGSHRQSLRRAFDKFSAAEVAKNSFSYDKIRFVEDRHQKTTVADCHNCEEQGQKAPIAWQPAANRDPISLGRK